MRCSQATSPEDPSSTESERTRDPAIPPEIAASVEILVADGERSTREGAALVLQSLGFGVTTVGQSADALALLRRRRFDLVLLDLELQAASDTDLLAAAIDAYSETVVIVTTTKPSVASSLEALRAGAWDYLPKPFSASHLEILVGRATHNILSGRSRPRLPHEGREGDDDPILGRSAAVRGALEVARRAAPTGAPVMVMCESGNGRGRMARLVHSWSSRAGNVFLTVNCGALTKAELFGRHPAPGDDRDLGEPGLLEAAAGGTVFLDDLDDLPPPLQPALLRVIQDGALPPARRGQAAVPVNLRFIAALDDRGGERARRPRVSQDLVRQLSAVTIKLPPLRERPGDIPGIAEYLLECCWQHHHGDEAPKPRLAPATLSWLQSLPWRGNVRQLQRVMERLSLISEPASEIGPDDVPLVSDTMEEAAGGIYAAILDDAYNAAKEKLLEQFEREYLPRVVSRASGNMARAARLADVDRKTLYRLMEKHGLRPRRES
ncbi:MAG TPA: sigma 54-interacting transcriptional regulator [Gemmatimonadaceae bacterium]|nr:sigma 54-interacting transcriptional regulator [Gemmatimonadaceae bacterium]